MIFKEKKSLYHSRLSKKLNDHLIDIWSKKHQEYINEFSRRIACNREKVCNNVVMNDINSSKSTYENTSKINKKYEGNKEKVMSWRNSLLHVSLTLKWDRILVERLVICTFILYLF